MPCVLECRNLGSGPFSALLCVENVIGGIGVEERIEIDKIDTRIRNVFAENV